MKLSRLEIAAYRFVDASIDKVKIDVKIEIAFIELKKQVIARRAQVAKKEAVKSKGGRKMIQGLPTWEDLQDRRMKGATVSSLARDLGVSRKTIDNRLKENVSRET